MGPDLNDDLHPQIPHDHIESQVQTGEVTWNGKGENIARLAEDGPESASEKRSLSRIPIQKKIKFESEEDLRLENYIETDTGTEDGGILKRIQGLPNRADVWVISTSTSPQNQLRGVSQLSDTFTPYWRGFLPFGLPFGVSPVSVRSQQLDWHHRWSYSGLACGGRLSPAWGFRVVSLRQEANP